MALLTSAPARPAARAHQRRTGAKGGTLRRSFAARVFNPAVARAGLPDELTFHGLRHVAASFLVDAGEHPRVIQHRLGHATARLSMELYAHVPETTTEMSPATSTPDSPVEGTVVRQVTGRSRPTPADDQGMTRIPSAPVRP